MPNELNSSKNNKNGKFLNRTNKQFITISIYNHMNTTPTIDTKKNNSNTGWSTHLYRSSIQFFQHNIGTTIS